MAKRNLSLEKIEETIRTEKIKQEKTKFPKICFTRYYGKENLSYYVIIIKHKNFIEGRTAWKKKGR